MSVEQPDWQPTILIVDDEPANIRVLAGVLSSDYRILAATGGEEAMNIIFSRAGEIDLILMDILMPGLNGYDVCARIRSYPETARIPIVFITAKTTPDEEAQGLDMGAVDYIGKPFQPVIVKARVRTQLELKKHKDHLDELVAFRTRELVDTRKDIVRRLARAAEARDNETGMHIVRLSHLCGLLARAYGLPREAAETLATASLMHDIGKIGIPDAILLKPGKHTDEEREIMKTHTTLGGDILAGPDSELLSMARDIALTHHERWDGTGYPTGLRGKDIPLPGRITSVCDVFDALTSERPYKRAWSTDEACDFLRENSGTMFDPELVDLFLQQRVQVETILEDFRDTAEEPVGDATPVSEV